MKNHNIKNKNLKHVPKINVIGFSFNITCTFRIARNKFTIAIRLFRTVQRDYLKNFSSNNIVVCVYLIVQACIMHSMFLL